MAIENRVAADALKAPAEEHTPAPVAASEARRGARAAPPASSSGALSGPVGASAAASRAADFAQLLEMVERAPHEFDFFQLLRRLQTFAPDRPRIGEAQDPAKEPIRMGQEPSMAFAPSELSALRRSETGGPPRLLVNFFGLLGPNGPLPLHLTEYARERLRLSDDPTLSRFLDVFHHRMLLLMFRAWASARPTVSHDRRDNDRFVAYVGALGGIGMPTLQGRDRFPDSAKLFYVGRLAGQTHNAEGLAAVISDFFEMPARIQEFVPDWLDLAPRERWKLGGSSTGGRLGRSTTLGARVASRQSKFRVLLGPLDRGQFHRMLPGGQGLATLTSLVRSYAGDEHRWDVRLSLHERVDEPWRLGRARLGWTTWPGRPAPGQSRRDDLVLDPQGEALRAVA
jgi:type VI secretion system protein ImpH